MNTTRMPRSLRSDQSAPFHAGSGPEQHGILRSLLLHLAPGLLSLGFYILVAPAVQAWGFPPLFASILTVPLVIVPFMLGWLALEARRATGRYSPLAVVQYRERVPVRRMAAWSAALIAWGAIAFAAAEAAGVAEPLRTALSGLPSWFLRPAEFDAVVAMGTPQLVIFLASMVLVVGTLAPTVEELYFRGYLMPALGRLGAWTPVLGVALFTHAVGPRPDDRGAGREVAGWAGSMRGARIRSGPALPS
jgi:uncharacterized protein